MNHTKPAIIDAFWQCRFCSKNELTKKAKGAKVYYKCLIGDDYGDTLSGRNKDDIFGLNYINLYGEDRGGMY